MQQLQKGHLKIFFSYAQGTGKTTAMLKAAQNVQAQGMKVCIGYLSSPASADVLSLCRTFDQLKPVKINEKDYFDLDQALKYRPDLILLDDLACSNGNACRHRKRYQDVDELLKSGINVYTTVNVENIESLHDTVSFITGISAWERIPDFVFDQADQVELIDIEPQELLEQLEKSTTAGTLFTIEQLTALREAALRRCADRVKHLSNQQHKNSYHTNEHILVGLSSAPSNERIIRTAARMANAFNSQFTALFVETPDFGAATPENKQRLRHNQNLADQLGAHIETVYGEDVAYQLAEFARLSGITKIVLGRSAVTRKHRLGKPTLTEQLIFYVPEMDIHIIPDKSADASYRPRKAKRHDKNSILTNTAESAAILTGATLLSLGFYRMGFTEPNIIMVYILGVLLTSIATSHQIYSLVSSMASVFIFNFFFTHPRFSLTAYATGYPVTFAVMFLTAYITGTLALRYKKQAGQSAKIAYRTKILFDTDQMLSKAGNKAEIIEAAAEQMMKLLNRTIVIFEQEGGRLLTPHIFSPDTADREKTSAAVGERETAAASWTLNHNHTCGAATDTFSDARFMYLSLCVNERVYGVVGIDAQNNPLDAPEYGILLSILGECALALENEKNAREKEAAAVLAESEQLRANLLRTISHDLRTPLTTISGNASNLLSNGDSFDALTKKQIYTDIYDDSMWLINLVENLLYATRIEEGRMTLHTSTELLSDIVEEAMNPIRRKAGSRRIFAVHEDDLLFVQADAKLIVQVIVNLVDNAAKYTPPDTAVTITAERNGGMAEIRIADNGNGIPDEEKPKIFEKFYCGRNKIADNRRSLGLGLYLCKAITEAHGGTISVTDNQPQGSIFCFTLPIKEITPQGGAIHE